MRLAECHRAVGGRRGRDVKLLLPLLIPRHDLADVGTRLLEGRHSAVSVDVALACVVRGDRVLQISVERPARLLARRV